MVILMKPIIFYHKEVFFWIFLYPIYPNYELCIIFVIQPHTGFANFLAILFSLLIHTGIIF